MKNVPEVANWISFLRSFHKNKLTTISIILVWAMLLNKLKKNNRNLLQVINFLIFLTDAKYFMQCVVEITDSFGAESNLARL